MAECRECVQIVKSIEDLTSHSFPFSGTLSSVGCSITPSRHPCLPEEGSDWQNQSCFIFNVSNLLDLQRAKLPYLIFSMMISCPGLALIVTSLSFCLIMVIFKQIMNFPILLNLVAKYGWKLIIRPLFVSNSMEAPAYHLQKKHLKNLCQKSSSHCAVKLHCW